jgi:hypothetical protein
MEGKGNIFNEEQIKDIVYWASSGESMTATAALMDLTAGKFIRDIRKSGLEGIFVNGCKSNARKAHLNLPRNPAIARKASKTRYGTQIVDGIKDTIKNHAKRRGVGLAYTYELIRAGATLESALKRRK